MVSEEQSILEETALVGAACVSGQKGSEAQRTSLPESDNKTKKQQVELDYMPPATHACSQLYYPRFLSLTKQHFPAGD